MYYTATNSGASSEQTMSRYVEPARGLGPSSRNILIFKHLLWFDTDISKNRLDSGLIQISFY